MEALTQIKLQIALNALRVIYNYPVGDDPFTYHVADDALTLIRKTTEDSIENILLNADKSVVDTLAQRVIEEGVIVRPPYAELADMQKPSRCAPNYEEVDADYKRAVGTAFNDEQVRGSGDDTR